VRVLQEHGMATSDMVQQRPELLLWMTKTLVQAVAAAARASGAAEEKVRAAAALG